MNEYEWTERGHDGIPILLNKIRVFDYHWLAEVDKITEEEAVNHYMKIWVWNRQQEVSEVRLLPDALIIRYTYPIQRREYVKMPSLPKHKSNPKRKRG
jgi:hypothetical protein